MREKQLRHQRRQLQRLQRLALLGVAGVGLTIASQVVHADEPALPSPTVTNSAEQQASDKQTPAGEVTEAATPADDQKTTADQGEGDKTAPATDDKASADQVADKDSTAPEADQPADQKPAEPADQPAEKTADAAKTADKSSDDTPADSKNIVTYAADDKATDSKAVETQPQTSGMNYDQINVGDYSSILGTWSAGGSTLFITEDGLFGPEMSFKGLKTGETRNIKDRGYGRSLSENGHPVDSVPSGMEGRSYEYVKKGDTAQIWTGSLETITAEEDLIISSGLGYGIIYKRVSATNPQVITVTAGSYGMGILGDRKGNSNLTHEPVKVTAQLGETIDLNTVAKHFTTEGAKIYRVTLSNSQNGTSMDLPDYQSSFVLNAETTKFDKISIAYESAFVAKDPTRTQGGQATKQRASTSAQATSGTNLDQLNRGDYSSVLGTWEVLKTNAGDKTPKIVTEDGFFSKEFSLKGVQTGQTIETSRYRYGREVNKETNHLMDWFVVKNSDAGGSYQFVKKGESYTYYDFETRQYVEDVAGEDLIVSLGGRYFTIYRRGTTGAAAGQVLDGQGFDAAGDQGQVTQTAAPAQAGPSLPNTGDKPTNLALYGLGLLGGLFGLVTKRKRSN